MSEMKTGISKTMFVVGLIVAIVASSLIASVVSMQFTKGLKGDKGDIGATGTTGATGPQGIQGITGATGATGPTGPQGPKGDKGDSGTVTASVSAALLDAYTDNIISTDSHHVTGYIINFGSSAASAVQIDLTWNMGGGAFVYKTVYVGTMSGHSIQHVDVTYSFNGQGSLSNSISWT
jgi:hypothetical protein